MGFPHSNRSFRIRKEALTWTKRNVIKEDSGFSIDLMSKNDGIKMVLKYDHVTPKDDLIGWSNYVNMTEDEFYYYANKFSDPRVWSKKDGYWCKIDIDGEERKYHKSI